MVTEWVFKNWLFSEAGCHKMDIGLLQTHDSAFINLGAECSIPAIKVVIIKQQHLCEGKYIPQEAEWILASAPNLSNLSIQQVPHQNLQTSTSQSAEFDPGESIRRIWSVDETNLDMKNNFIFIRLENVRNKTKQNKLIYGYTIKITLKRRGMNINPAWRGIKIRAPNSFERVKP